MVPSNAKYQEVPAGFEGYYWNCAQCHEVLSLPEGEFGTAVELCDCKDCLDNADACAFDCHDHAPIGEMCKGCLEIEINRAEVRDEIERVMGRK